MKLLALLLFAFPAWGVDYYVDTDARNGSDSCTVDDGAGSLGDPWASLHYATSQLTPGDTLYIRGGLYREDYSAWGNECGDPTRTMNVSSISGTIGSPVLIRPYQNENVVIDTTPLWYETAGSDWTQCESSGTCGACSISNANYASMYYRSVNVGSAPRAQVYVDPGLITEGAASPGQRLHYNSSGIRTSADFGVACSDINGLVAGTFSTAGGSTNQTTVYLSDGSDPDTHRLVCASELGGCGTHSILIQNSNYVTVSGYGDDGQKHLQILGGYYTVYVNGSDNITLEGFYAHNSGSNEYGSAVRTGDNTDFLLVDDVGIEDVTAEGISLYAGGNSSCSSGNSNITIQNSRVVRTGQDIVGMKGISQTLGDGIFGKGTEAASILYNYVEDTQRDGITISPSGSCQSNNWIIRGNIINNACNNPRDEECAGIATKQHSVAGSSTSTGHIIENNLIYGLSGRSGATGIRGMRQTGWDNAFGNNIWRYNTVVTDGATGYGLHIDGASGVQPSDVIGNLFVANGSQTTLYSGTGANVGTTAYNTYWTPGSNDQVYNVGGTTATRATITSSIEPTAIQTAPIFDTGYELASNSPQVDAGNTQCQGDDWIGTPRPVDTDCDVGGFEYATLAAPEIPAGLNVVVTP